MAVTYYFYYLLNRHILTCLDEAFTILENKEESDGTLAEENALFFLSPLAELGTYRLF